MTTGHGSVGQIHAVASTRAARGHGRGPPARGPGTARRSPWPAAWHRPGRRRRWADRQTGGSRRWWGVSAMRATLPAIESSASRVRAMADCIAPRCSASGVGAAVDGERVAPAHRHDDERRVLVRDPLEDDRAPRGALGVLAVERRVPDRDVGRGAGRLGERQQAPVVHRRRPVQGREPLRRVRVAEQHDRRGRARVAERAGRRCHLVVRQVAAVVVDRREVVPCLGQGRGEVGRHRERRRTRERRGARRQGVAARGRARGRARVRRAEGLFDVACRSSAGPPNRCRRA